MKQYKVILVDDKPIYRKVMRNQLQRLGNVEIMEEANNGQELLDMLEKGQIPDIIFMDIEMPVMNGLEATKAVMSKYPYLVVIGLSLYDNEHYIKRLIEYGARGYLLKLSNNVQILRAILKHPEAEIFYSQEIGEAISGVEKDTKKYILIVDDFEANTFAVGFALERAGYAVKRAHSGAEALEIYRNNHFDMLVTDYRMPEMTGIDLIHAIKKEAKYKNIPILMLTTEKGEKEKQLAKEAGITGWVQKPFDLNRFLAIINRAFK